MPRLAESHVYPKALHLLFVDSQDDLPPFMINRKAAYQGQTIQKSRGGVYGRFVCHVCESDLFGPADNEFMRLHHRLSSWPLPDEQIEIAPTVVPGDPALVHRFALQTLWRWAIYPGTDFEQVDAIGFGPVIQRIRDWLLNPVGTLWTKHEITVSYRIADDHGFVLPPCGGWRAGVIVMTIGKFTFFIASRARGLRDSLKANRLQAEAGVRLLATTRMHDWIIDPAVDVLGDGRMELADRFLERMRDHTKIKKG